ncbi:MAG: nitroreductase family protein [Eubacterium ramulus]
MLTIAFYNAPCLVVISTHRLQIRQWHNVPYSNAAAMMAEHMCLLATDLGIGSCNIWGAIAALNTKPELVAKLGLPEGHVPCCAVTLGDTDDTFAEREIPADRIAVSYIN